MFIFYNFLYHVDGEICFVCVNLFFEDYVLLDTSSRYFVTAGRVEQYAYYHITNLRIQLVQEAPDDGPMRSETCRTNISDE